MSLYTFNFSLCLFTIFMIYRCKDMRFFEEIQNIFEKVAATFKISSIFASGKCIVGRAMIRNGGRVYP